MIVWYCIFPCMCISHQSKLWFSWCNSCIVMSVVSQASCEVHVPSYNIDHVLLDIQLSLSLPLPSPSLPPSLSLFLLLLLFPSAFPSLLCPLLWRSINSRLWVWSITLFLISYSRPEKGQELFWMESPLEYPNALVSQSWSGISLSHYYHHSSYFYHYSQGIKYYFMQSV